MAEHFTKHYTLDEARALLPQIRRWLERLADFRGQLQKFEPQLKSITDQGVDAGGDLVNRWVRAMAGFRTVLAEFETREIQLKDIDRGLLDFPAYIAGREVFLCWEKDEDDIEHWHDLDTGYAGRERL